MIYCTNRKSSQTQFSQLDTKNDKDPNEHVMSVVHSPHLKEEIDLTCLTDGSVPPSVHHYLKLKTKRISMGKVQTIANLANEVEYDYSLSSIPPSTSEHLTQGN